MHTSMVLLISSFPGSQDPKRRREKTEGRKRNRKKYKNIRNPHQVSICLDLKGGGKVVLMHIRAVHLFTEYNGMMKIFVEKECHYQHEFFHFFRINLGVLFVLDE